MGRARSVRATTRIHERRMSPGFTAFGLRDIPGYALDPFLSLDEFRMSEPTFPPHPHAGFSAVTYMFEDSHGTFTNRDSLGNDDRIGPGTLHWSQAARGMMHEEIPETRGVECHGLQMFVNLRSDDKQVPPRAFHVDTRAIPEIVAAEGARVRVLAGNFAGVCSPLSELLTPILLLDVHLSGAACVTIPVQADWTCFVMSISGAGLVGPQDARHAFGAHEAAGFAGDGDEIQLKAGGDGLHVLLAAGKPLGEPVVFGGPFVTTNRSELQAAFDRYERGEMGSLSPSF
jgi:redox-sensitive bicupin YhaK (pirin superfamily)